jgi:hypothetical protein
MAESIVRMKYWLPSPSGSLIRSIAVAPLVVVPVTWGTDTVNVG